MNLKDKLDKIKEITQAVDVNISKIDNLKKECKYKIISDNDVRCLNCGYIFQVENFKEEVVCPNCKEKLRRGNFEDSANPK